MFTNKEVHKFGTRFQVTDSGYIHSATSIKKFIVEKKTTKLEAIRFAVLGIADKISKK